MTREYLLQRLDELRGEHGSWVSIAKRSSMQHPHLTRLRNYLGAEEPIVSLKHIKAIGEAHDLAPVVFYRQDGEIEDLGIEDFLNGPIVDNYLGKAIKKHRELKGYSQEFLAEKVDNSWISMSRYECGHRIPDFKVFENISREIELIPVYLAKFSLSKNIQQIDNLSISKVLLPSARDSDSMSGELNLREYSRQNFTQS